MVRIPQSHQQNTNMGKKASPKFSLTINKRDINFNVGLGFLGEYQENYGNIQDTLEKIETNPFYHVPKLMYASALYESRGDLEIDDRDWET